MSAPLTIDTPGETLDVYISCGSGLQTRVSLDEVCLRLSNVTGTIRLVVRRSDTPQKQAEKIGFESKQVVPLFGSPNLEHQRAPIHILRQAAISDVNVVPGSVPKSISAIGTKGDAVDDHSQTQKTESVPPSMLQSAVLANKGDEKNPSAQLFSLKQASKARSASSARAGGSSPAVLDVGESMLRNQASATDLDTEDLDDEAQIRGASRAAASAAAQRSPLRSPSQAASDSKGAHKNRRVQQSPTKPKKASGQKQKVPVHASPVRRSRRGRGASGTAGKAGESGSPARNGCLDSFLRTGKPESPAVAMEDDGGEDQGSTGGAGAERASKSSGLELGSKRPRERGRGRQSSTRSARTGASTDGDAVEQQEQHDISLAQMSPGPGDVEDALDLTQDGGSSELELETDLGGGVDSLMMADSEDDEPRKSGKRPPASFSSSSSAAASSAASVNSQPTTRQASSQHAATPSSGTRAGGASGTAKGAGHETSPDWLKSAAAASQSRKDAHGTSGEAADASEDSAPKRRRLERVAGEQGGNRQPTMGSSSGSSSSSAGPSSGAGSGDVVEEPSSQSMTIPQSIADLGHASMDMDQLVEAASAVVRGQGRPVPQVVQRALVSIAQRLEAGRPAQVLPRKADGPAPKPRWGHVSCLTSHGCVAVHGGSTNESGEAVSLGDTLQFDFGELAWEEPRGHKPDCRAWHALTPAEHTAMAISFGGENKPSSPVSTVQTLDLDVALWFTPNISGSPPSARTSPAMCCLGKSMVVFGGQAKRGQPQDVHVLDLEKYCWDASRPKGKSPSGRTFHTLTATDSDTAVLFGGVHDDDALGDVHLLTAQMVEAGSGKKGKKKNSPGKKAGKKARGKSASSSSAGGSDADHDEDEDDVELDEFTAANQGSSVSLRWSALECFGDKPSPRFGHTATRIGDGLVLFLGGWDCPDFPEDVAYYVLNTHAQAWHKLEVSREDAGMLRRTGHSAVLLPGGLAGALQAAGWNKQALKEYPACEEPCLAVFGGFAGGAIEASEAAASGPTDGGASKGKEKGGKVAKQAQGKEEDDDDDVLEGAHSGDLYLLPLGPAIRAAYPPVESSAAHGRRARRSPP